MNKIRNHDSFTFYAGLFSSRYMDTFYCLKFMTIILCEMSLTKKKKKKITKLNHKFILVIPGINQKKGERINSVLKYFLLGSFKNSVEV